jgi:hypothetical protein
MMSSRFYDAEPLNIFGGTGLADKEGTFWEEIIVAQPQPFALLLELNREVGKLLEVDGSEAEYPPGLNVLIAYWVGYRKGLPSTYNIYTVDAILENSLREGHPEIEALTPALFVEWVDALRLIEEVRAAKFPSADAVSTKSLASRERYNQRKKEERRRKAMQKREA